MKGSRLIVYRFRFVCRALDKNWEELGKPHQGKYLLQVRVQKILKTRKSKSKQVVEGNVYLNMAAKIFQK